MIINKEKQKKGTVQNEAVFLYKPYNILISSSSETSFLDKILQNKINNLEKVLKSLQSSIKTIPFLSPNYYKTIQVNGNKNKTY